MNKSELIRNAANEVGLKLVEATEFFDAIINSITNTLNAGETVQISGFGSFGIKTKPAGEGINPKTGEKISIDERKIPVFKFGKAYKDLFNK